MTLEEFTVPIIFLGTGQLGTDDILPIAVCSKWRGSIGPEIELLATFPSSQSLSHYRIGSPEPIDSFGVVLRSF